MILYSSSQNGAIYEWSIEKGSRISDIVLQDTNLKGLVVLPDDKMVCIGADGRIIEIKETKVRQIINTPTAFNRMNFY